MPPLMISEEAGRATRSRRAPALAHLWRVVFDATEKTRDRDHRDGAPIVGSHLDAERAELVGDVTVLALIEGAVGALDLCPRARISRASDSRRRRRYPRSGSARRDLPSLAGNRYLPLKAGMTPAAEALELLENHGRGVPTAGRR